MVQVKQFYNKNQFLIKDYEKPATYFQSYDSVCAMLDEFGKVTLFQDWDYSQTTRKHLYIFFDEIARYSCDRHTREAAQAISEAKNKRTAVQKCIDDGIFMYTEI